MKLTPRFIVRAGLVLSAAGAIGAFGACKDKGITPPPPPVPPPPPGAPAAPINVQAAAASETAINVTWTDASDNEDGFKIEACSGASCTNFAQVGAVAANATTFSNTGLTANTDYSYRVLAFNSVGASPSGTATAKTPLIAPPAGTVMIGAGEITSCNTTAATLTAGLIDAELAKNPNAIIYTVGNNLSDVSSGASFQNCFEPRWGAKFKANPNFHVALGQRDYEVGTPPGGTDAVYAYFGDKAGQPNGWYSFDVGTSWRVIVLNSATWQHGAVNLTDGASAQNTWLAEQLTNNPRKCTVAIFNLRRYYSYGSMENGNAKTVWRILHAGGAEMVLSGTDKYYERWAPQNHDMGRDDAAGVRQFIIGTGGRTLDQYQNGTPPVWKPIEQVPNLEARDNSTHGVLKLTLNANSYDWEFIPVTAGGYTDKGTTQCH
jgi:hypothetical protein